MQDLLIFLDFIKKLYMSRYMIKTMAVRELRAVYVGSLFGLLWAIINPLSQVVIYGVVFGIFFKATPPPESGTDSFVLYLMTGLVPWQFFASSVGASTGILLANQNLIKKTVAFPSEVLTIVSIISNIINHLISLCLLLLIVAIFKGGLSFYIFTAFIYLFFAAIFCVGISWILSSVTVFLRDTPQVIGMTLMMLFFFTPIFYSPEIVPPNALFIMRLNPIYHMVEGYKLAVLGSGILPAWDIAYLAVSSFLTFGLGGMLFRRLKPAFAEVL